MDREVDQISFKAIGLRLRLIREHMGKDQGEMASLLGMTRQAWNNNELGVKRIKIDNATRLCAISGVTTDWIYRDVWGTLPVDLAVALRERMDAAA
jgi:transcriptional regulator with XRE-family HTH domain